MHIHILNNGEYTVLVQERTQWNEVSYLEAHPRRTLMKQSY